MQLEAKKYLYDIAEAAEQIAAFTAGKAFADYEGDAMLRSAVERQFEIVGEALGQLARLHEAIAARMTDPPPLIQSTDASPSPTASRVHATSF